MNSQNTSLNYHYRKLDIYIRVFILNYGDLSHLDSTVVKLKDNDLILGDLLNLKAKSLKDGYLDLSNLKLVLASMSFKRLKAIFRKVLLELLKKDNRIRINAKLISKIKSQLSESEYQAIFSVSEYPVKLSEEDSIKSYSSDISNQQSLLKSETNIKTKISELLAEYSISQIVSGLMAVYFDNLHESLGYQIDKRFHVNQYRNVYKNYIDKSALDNLVDSIVLKVMPITSQIIEQFKNKENN
ncbi:MAG: hypothetical protein ACK5Z5_00570 [Neisseriaceae bacterium]